MAYVSKSKALQILHQSVSHIASERLQHLVASGQWSWTHPSNPTNFVKDFPGSPYCALVKKTRSSFSYPIPIPDQIGSLFFADV